MNYDLKQLLGQQHPKLLHAQHVTSWELVHKMRDTEYIESSARRCLTIKLADKVLETTEISQDNTLEGLQFRVKVFFHSKEELQELLGKAYRLGQESYRPMPIFSNF